VTKCYNQCFMEKKTFSFAFATNTIYFVTICHRDFFILWYFWGSWASDFHRRKENCGSFLDEFMFPHLERSFPPYKCLKTLYTLLLVSFICHIKKQSYFLWQQKGHPSKKARETKTEQKSIKSSEYVIQPPIAYI
jgi:hypothetical protein